MHNIQARWLLVVGSLVIIFAATGCFQTAGEQLQTTSVAQGVATFTPDSPQETPISDSDATEEVSPTDVSSALVASEEPSPTIISAFPTLTPTATTTPQTAAQVASPTPESAASVNQQEGLDEPAQTATALIITATAQQEQILTATAAAEGIGLPTPPPAPTLAPDQGGGGGVATFTPIPQPILPGQDCIHEVQATDRNLWRISLYYGVTVHEIAAASGIANINLIRVGQRLTIPGCGTTGNRPPPTSIPTSGDTGIPPVGSQVYVVRQNDTLFQISLRYGVPVQTLAAVNSIVNPNLIFIGQQIVIP